MTRQSTRRRRYKLTAKGDCSDTCEVVSDGTDLFIVFNGERIAKRGPAHTPQEETWSVWSPDTASPTILELAG